MRFLLFAGITTLCFFLTSCNRAPDSAAEAETISKMEKEVDEAVFQGDASDYGQKAISQFESRVTLTEEQKAEILKMSSEYDFANASVSERSDMVKKMVERIKSEVLTEDQLKKARNK
ncbi:hypothetical protein FUA23_20530 [Neolewinella aurantiaca]|uniref:DUF4168 domain-containing protein n=1 Tax=Neolewinella aurantiaca TaxID=2602767 RepID=A0A5C7FDR5_9BACT|nr:hypothetical protein [Neolewinella aurantiaca]TXF85447.1 hypothetical protein FUA23_20530 [Neolewinella aurantiaca]